jgi:hypothetical protein
VIRGAGASARAMDDLELAGLLSRHEARAIGYYNSEIADQQARAINYYYGLMDDVPAMDGCSSVVDHTVSVMVDNGLAAVLKPFVSAEQVVSFDPRSEAHVEQAAQATEFVNYVLNCDNAGFLILHDWFKDALLTKIGVVKIWWEDRTREELQTIPVDALGLEAARKGDDYRGEAEVQPGLYTVTRAMTVPDGRIRIENVPPEEFLITPFARSLDCQYVAHRPSGFTRSDLIEMGIDADVVESLPAAASVGTEESRSQARYRDEDWASDARDGPGGDRSQDVLAILDEYVRCDYDGDGVAELRRVVRVDDVILLNEPVDDCPFALICPVPMPHKIYGRSIADQSMEGQKVATAVKRQTLDNLYKSNNPRPIINETGVGDSTMDDLGSTAPGAAIRIRTPGTLDWMVVPFAAQHSFPMLEYVARETEERTGIQRKGNGFNAEALRKNSPDTATQAMIDENSRNERAEMIARIFAETGVKRLFRLILRLLVAHQPRERVVRLRGKWVGVDPRGWDPDMDMIISVGLGIGNKAEQVAQADAVLRTMVDLHATPYAGLIDAGKVYNAIRRKLVATGIQNVGDFLRDPGAEGQGMPPAQGVPAQPDPAELELRMKQQEAAMKLQLQQQESAARIQLMREEAGAKLQFQREKAAAEAQVAREKMMAEVTLERERMAMEIGLRREGAAAQPSPQPAEFHAGGDLDK